MKEAAELSDLDMYVIDRVRALRKERKISQAKLSQLMGLAEGFISKVENPKVQAKYNIKHLNLLARCLDCTLWELLPERPL